MLFNPTSCFFTAEEKCPYLHHIFAADYTAGSRIKTAGTIALHYGGAAAVLWSIRWLLKKVAPAHKKESGADLELPHASAVERFLAAPSKDEASHKGKDGANPLHQETASDWAFEGDALKAVGV